jgi:hypothetical protein
MAAALGSAKVEVEATPDCINTLLQKLEGVER